MVRFRVQAINDLPKFIGRYAAEQLQNTKQVTNLMCGNYSAAKRHKRHKQGMGWNMDLMEPVKLDLNRSRACSRCAFCAFLRLCLSSYKSNLLILLGRRPILKLSTGDWRISDEIRQSPVSNQKLGCDTKLREWLL
jgi:hypothetical protein